MMKYDWIIFDFNGTLYDDWSISFRMANYYLREKGLPETTKEEYRKEFCFPVINYYRLKGIIKEDSEYEYYKDDYLDRYLQFSDTGLASHAIEVLESLQKNYSLGIISILNQKNLEEQCSGFGIAQYFQTIIGQDNTYAASKHTSAAHFIQSNNLDPARVLFIGDTLTDYDVAREVGADCILYDQGYQSHELLETSGKKVISDLIELLDIL